MRTNIQYSSFDSEVKAIVVTSSEPGEGKSTTAGNLAISFAQAEQRTIIVDCDLRKPSLHKKFKISNINGLSDVLIGKKTLDESIYRFNDKMDILTSGKIPPNPSEMLGSMAMGKLIEVLKEKYDIIILDTAPLQAVTDAQILSTRCDGTILVVKTGETKAKEVLNTIDLLNKVKGNILGIVLKYVEVNNKKYVQ